MWGEGSTEGLTLWCALDGAKYVGIYSLRLQVVWETVVWGTVIFGCIGSGGYFMDFCLDLVPFDSGGC